MGTMLLLLLAAVAVVNLLHARSTAMQLRGVVKDMENIKEKVELIYAVVQQPMTAGRKTPVKNRS